MSTDHQELRNKGQAAKAASRRLAHVPVEIKNKALGSIADALVARESEILKANQQDYQEGKAAGMGTALLDRLVTRLHPDIEDNLEGDNPKGKLQEWAQLNLRERPVYETLESSGPDHAKTFKVAVHIRGECYGIGVASRLRTAEQEAVREIFQFLAEAVNGIGHAVIDRPVVVAFELAEIRVGQGTEMRVVLEALEKDLTYSSVKTALG